jgi:hypothetical protein
VPAAGGEQADGKYLEPLHAQLPLWQLVPAAQAAPQLPQLALSLSVLMQPRPGQQR